MAAGMGSRFGGLKQTEPITDDGRVILDFSVYDAIKAGFTKVVFIIRREMFSEFRKLVGNRIAKTVDVDYVFQDNFDLPKGRVKPFGTGHAILCCKGIVNEPFAVINADDYYGMNAFQVMQHHLKTAKTGEWAMAAYRLENTLSKNGGVARGICAVKNGYLETVTEITNIDSNGGYVKDGKRELLPLDSLVSMNMWGLTPDIFNFLETEYRWFLKRADLSKDEFYIPSVISRAIERGKAQVKVFKTSDKWYGITYREDLEEIKNAIGGYIENGLYERS
jgi:NDP-sugar pyrophosphorylase family protein